MGLFWVVLYYFLIKFFLSVFKHVDIYMYTYNRRIHKYTLIMYRLYNGVKEKQK